jgi:hypothetical protein
VLAKLGIPVTYSDLFGVGGSAWLDGLALPQPYRGKVGWVWFLCRNYTLSALPHPCTILPIWPI